LVFAAKGDRSFILGDRSSEEIMKLLLDTHIGHSTYAIGQDTGKGEQL